MAIDRPDRDRQVGDPRVTFVNFKPVPLMLAVTKDDETKDDSGSRVFRYPRSRSNEDEVRFFLQPGMQVRAAPCAAAETCTVAELDDVFVYLRPNN